MTPLIAVYTDAVERLEGLSRRPLMRDILLFPFPKIKREAAAAVAFPIDNRQCFAAALYWTLSTRQLLPDGPTFP